MKIKLLGFQLIIGIALFDLSAALLFRQKVRMLYGNYLNARAGIGRGYPRYHHYAVKKRGFDIRPNSAKTLVTQKPSEHKGYLVWGNNIGCFDNELKPNQKYDIYLAGDSYTWGYTSFERKFGTLLEGMRKVKIAKCGVTHTGQAHQFDKFKDIVNNIGYYPKIVIVSIYKNDVYNDYIYPSTTIIKGYQVDYKKLVNGKILKIPFNELENRFKSWSYSQTNNRKFLRDLLSLKHWSATYVIIDHGIRRINELYLRNRLESKPLKKSPFSKEAYNIKNPYSRHHMQLIAKWLKDARINQYQLIFVTIPDKKSTSSTYAGFHQYLNIIDGTAWDFADFVFSKFSLDEKSRLFWVNDPHFNERGNQIYADYLHQNLNRLKIES